MKRVNLFKYYEIGARLRALHTLTEETEPFSTMEILKEAIGALSELRGEGLRGEGDGVLLLVFLEGRRFWRGEGDGVLLLVFFRVNKVSAGLRTPRPLAYRPVGVRQACCPRPWSASSQLLLCAG